MPVSIFLLTSAWIAPESRVVKMLLGRSSIEKELAQVETRGYYESILDASKLLHRDPSGNAGRRYAASSSRLDPLLRSGACRIRTNVPAVEAQAQS